MYVHVVMSNVKVEPKETVMCGEYEVPEQFHNISGWEVEPHEYIMENVSDLWGRNSETIHGMVPWKATRFDTPIEQVALVLVERHTRDELEWQLHREITLASQSKRVKEHPNVGKFFSTPDLDWGLEIAKEWLEANPARTASSMFVPKNPETMDICERFPYYADETVEFEGGVITSDESIAVIKDDTVSLPQNETVDDFVVPDSLDVGERYIKLTVDNEIVSFARTKFGPYKPLVKADLTSEEMPIHGRIRVSPRTNNAIISCPNMNGFYVVAPLDNDIN